MSAFFSFFVNRLFRKTKKKTGLESGPVPCKIVAAIVVDLYDIIMLCAKRHSGRGLHYVAATRQVTTVC